MVQRCYERHQDLRETYVLIYKGMRAGLPDDAYGSIIDVMQMMGWRTLEEYWDAPADLVDECHARIEAQAEAAQAKRGKGGR